MYSTNEIIGWWRKPEYSEKTTDLSQVTDNLYHMMFYGVHLAWTGFQFTTLVVINTDCTGSCKSNYHTIMITTAPGSDKRNWWIPRSEQELLIVPEHLSSLPVLVASVLIDL